MSHLQAMHAANVLLAIVLIACFIFALIRMA
jgi:hypothetical protein